MFWFYWLKKNRNWAVSQFSFLCVTTGYTPSFILRSTYFIMPALCGEQSWRLPWVFMPLYCIYGWHSHTFHSFISFRFGSQAVLYRISRLTRSTALRLERLYWISTIYVGEDEKFLTWTPCGAALEAELWVGRAQSSWLLFAWWHQRDRGVVSTHPASPE